MISEGTKVPTYRSSGGAGRRQLERALRHGSALVAVCPGEQFTTSPRHGVLAYIPRFQFKEHVEVQLVSNDGTSHDGLRFTGERAGISIVSTVESVEREVDDVGSVVAAFGERHASDVERIEGRQADTVRAVKEAKQALSSDVSEIRETIAEWQAWREHLSGAVRSDHTDGS